MPIITLRLCCNTSKPRGGSGSRKKYGNMGSPLLCSLCLPRRSFFQPACPVSQSDTAGRAFLVFILSAAAFFSGGVRCACEVLSIRITAEGSEVPSLVELTL